MPEAENRRVVPAEKLALKTLATARAYSRHTVSFNDLVLFARRTGESVIFTTVV